MKINVHKEKKIGNKNTRKILHNIVRNNTNQQFTKKRHRKYFKKEYVQRNIHYVKDSPVIAILTIPNTFSKYKRTHSYLPNSYVKWIEMSGGRVVPVQYDLPTNLIKSILGQCNGVLFIGGQVDHNIISREYHDFIQTVKTIVTHLRAENDKGNYYPIFSICLGFELLSMLSNNPDMHQLEHNYNKHLGISQVEGRNYMAKNIFLKGNSRISKIFSKREKAYQARTPVVFENHSLGFLPNAPYMKQYGKQWDIVAVTPENKRSPRKYINMIEYKKYPFYGTQFHPEKVIYEWLVPEIVHSKVARSISKRLSAFFVDECRKNQNILYSRSLLIYNYTLFSRPEILKALRPKKYMLKKNKSSFETSYYFNINTRGI